MDLKKIDVKLLFFYSENKNKENKCGPKTNKQKANEEHTRWI